MITPKQTAILIGFSIEKKLHIWYDGWKLNDHN